MKGIYLLQCSTLYGDAIGGRKNMCCNIIEDEKKDEAEKIKTIEEETNDSTSVSKSKRKSYCTLS